MFKVYKLSTHSCIHPEVPSSRTIISCGSKYELSRLWGPLMVPSARCCRRWVSAIIADTLQNCSIKPSGCKGQRVRVPWRLRSKRSAHYSLCISLPLTRPWNEALTAQIKGCGEDSIPSVLHTLSCASAPRGGGRDAQSAAFNPGRKTFTVFYLKLNV